MATALPHETYETLAQRIRASRDRTTATIAPNTIASMDETGLISVRLHGNLIAQFYAVGIVWLSDGGWPTQTTARRLRALIPTRHCVYIRNGHIYGKRTDEPDRRAMPLDNGATFC